MTRFLLTLLALIATTPAAASTDMFLKVSTPIPMDSVPVDGEAAVLDAVLGDGQLLPTAAVDQSDVEVGGFAGSIINAIVIVEYPDAYDTAVVDGKDVELRPIASISMTGSTPLLLETPAGPQIFSIDTDSTREAALDQAKGASAWLADGTPGIEALIGHGGYQALEEVDLKNVSNPGFAGSVVSLRSGEPIDIEAVQADGEFIPVAARAAVASKTPAILVLVGPDGISLLEMVLPK